MKDLMFKIVCEAMQLRADDDIDVLDDKIRQLKLSIEILEDKLDRFFLIIYVLRPLPYSFRYIPSYTLNYRYRHTVPCLFIKSTVALIW